MKTSHKNAYLWLAIGMLAAATVNLFSDLSIIVPVLLGTGGLALLIPGIQNQLTNLQLHFLEGRETTPSKPIELQGTYKTAAVVLAAVLVFGGLGYLVGYGLAQIF